MVQLSWIFLYILLYKSNLNIILIEKNYYLNKLQEAEAFLCSKYHFSSDKIS